MNHELTNVASAFMLEGKIAEIKPLGNGLINDTFKITTADEATPDYVLQRINNAIFKDVNLLQHNIEVVTRHIRRKLEMRGEKDINRKVLTFVPTADGKTYLQAADGTFWRIAVFIPESFTYETVNPDYSYFAGKSFSEFEAMLTDVPEQLGETIPDFHNMALRARQLTEAINDDRVGRVKEVVDLLNEIEDTVDKGERVLVTTLTKRMAEELNTYLINIGIRACYIHSDVETLDRVEILQNLRAGAIDVLVGVNLLREGLDLPEVSLVAIMDADKEGFLRNVRSLTQTAGRAARHVNGRVIFYANKITKSMQATIDETNRRRSKQIAYNELHHITPKGVVKSDEMLLTGMSGENGKAKKSVGQYVQKEKKLPSVAEDMSMYNVEQLEKKKKELRKKMDKAVKELDFDLAAQCRDVIIEIENRIREY